MIKFFATDTFKNNSKFVKPDWIRQFILSPVIDVIDLLSDNKSDFYIAANLYIRSHKHQAAKFTDFVTYALTAILINIPLMFGGNPLFRTKNENTIGINKFLRENIKTLEQGEIKSNDIMHHCTTLYELFLQHYQPCLKEMQNNIAKSYLTTLCLLVIWTPVFSTNILLLITSHWNFP